MRRIRKSYKNLYSSKRRRRGTGAIKAVVSIILMAALVFIGYSIFPAIKKLTSGGWKVTNSSSTVSTGKPSSSAPSKKPPKTSSAVSSNPETAVTAKIRGAYLPKSYLSDTAALNKFITQAKTAGINLAVIDLKAEDGIVNYASAIPDIKGTEAIAQGAPDASAAAKALLAAGITPAARICAFQDPVAPTVIHGAGVMYSGNHSINWYDSSKNRWLNPYSPLAQNYIESLATEAVSLGYKQIFIDSLTFPTNGSPDTLGYYGSNMPSKEKVISDFVAALKQKVSSAGGKLTVMVSSAATIGQAQANIGQSQNFFSLSGDYISPNLCPSLLSKTGVTVGTTKITTPDLTPGKTVTTLANYLKTQNGTKMGETLPFIQDYTNTSLGSGYYKNYAATDVKAEISALANVGTSGYILYNPQGTYDFSVIK